MLFHIIIIKSYKNEGKVTPPPQGGGQHKNDRKRRRRTLRFLDASLKRRPIKDDNP
jgi:hypothetical protein